MEHRSKEGLTKAIIIDAILTGSDTRNALKERLNDIVTRKDLNYHLSKNTHNGLGFEHVLNERKGKISISMKNLNTISRAMDYLIKLPKYKEAFDMAFAECFFSGYGEALHHVPVIANQKATRMDGDYSTAWAALMPPSILLGTRVPWNLTEQTRHGLAKQALQVFEAGRGSLGTKLQLTYIANVIDKATADLYNEGATIARDTTTFISISALIRKAEEKNNLTVTAFNSIIEIANMKKKNILGNVSEREKELMKAALLLIGVFNWKAHVFNTVMQYIQERLNLHVGPDGEAYSQTSLEEILKILEQT